MMNVLVARKGSKIDFWTKIFPTPLLTTTSHLLTRECVTPPGPSTVIHMWNILIFFCRALPLFLAWFVPLSQSTGSTRRTSGSSIEKTRLESWPRLTMTCWSTTATRTASWCRWWWPRTLAPTASTTSTMTLLSVKCDSRNLTQGKCIKHINTTKNSRSKVPYEFNMCHKNVKCCHQKKKQNFIAQVVWESNTGKKK